MARYLLYISELTTTVTVLSVLGKMFIGGSFNVVYVFTAEIFPTEVRNTGFGLCSTCGRIGGITATFLGKELVIDQYCNF